MLLLVECKYKICMLYKNTFGQLKTGKDFQDIKHNLVDLQVLKKKKDYLLVSSEWSTMHTMHKLLMLNGYSDLKKLKYFALVFEYYLEVHSDLSANLLPGSSLNLLRLKLFSWLQCPLQKRNHHNDFQKIKA